MTLMTRIARLFRADLHAVLDRVEEPDVLLRAAVREMEEDLDSDRRRLFGLELEARRLAAREEELACSLGSQEEELDLCFAAGQVNLAKALIKRKLETARAAEALAKKRETLAAGRSDLEARIRENRERLERIRLKAEALTEALPERPAQPPYPDFAIRDEEVEVAFLREQRKRNPS